MNTRVAVPPNSSLSALRGAVSELVGAGDAVDGWNRLVSLWRIYRALDRLIAVLWSIVHRIAASEMPLDGRSPVVAVACERPIMAGSGLGRRATRRRPARLRTVLPRATVACVPAIVGRRVPVERVASPGRAHRLDRVSSVVAVRCRPFLDLARAPLRNCAVIVPV